ncbi:hypothetical protein NDU88_011476, partial [Pleurodeles waltl]
KHYKLQQALYRKSEKNKIKNSSQGPVRESKPRLHSAFTLQKPITEGCLSSLIPFSLQRLKAAVHYTVGSLCQEMAEEKQVHFSKQTIAALSEVTFRQCETFARDLEMFARHAKRSTINAEDVKLLARRSTALFAFITHKSEALASRNQEQKEKKKKKYVSAGKGARNSEEGLEAGAADIED